MVSFNRFVRVPLAVVQRRRQLLVDTLRGGRRPLSRPSTGRTPAESARPGDPWPQLSPDGGKYDIDDRAILVNCPVQ